MDIFDRCKSLYFRCWSNPSTGEVLIRVLGIIGIEKDVKIFIVKKEECTGWDIKINGETKFPNDELKHAISLELCFSPKNPKPGVRPTFEQIKSMK